MSFLNNTPNGGSITETNQQYYVGTQSNIASYTNLVLDSMVYTFNEILEMGSLDSWDPSNYEYHLNNFYVEVSPDGLSPYELWDGTGGVNSPAGPNGTGGGFTISQFSNTQSFSVLKFNNPDAVTDGYYVRVKLKSQLVDGAPNYGDYQYLSIFELVNNFMIGYVGNDKLISKVKRSDVLFYAKRGLQEFSYDTLRSVKSMELTIPPSLSVIIPQDYVNYVGIAWIDKSGIKHPIYPTNLTGNPTESPIQDTKIPKLAEEALYMHIAYSILASRKNVPEYLVARFKKDRRAQLRNAKIRLSNIKPQEFVQVMRGKAKWIKY